MKKFYFLMSLITFGLFVNSCKPAYVSVRPTYFEVSRPNRPSNKHIWINGDWVWNNQTKTYIRQDSYWTIPSRNRDYTQGEWKSTQRGYYWKHSRWR
ncbi:hypothetical protein [Emticicia sp. SJ17W-69]|uniref:hypothetical protein n=1 Tax=Emticicia sp. SJ17W-69 TaxID=3421657 RepID=UPI003EB87B6E